MSVMKRSGLLNLIDRRKVLARIEAMCYNLNMDFVKPENLASRIINGLTAGISTAEVDILIAETAASMSLVHADYAKLAARIVISKLHKETPVIFTDAMKLLHEATDPYTQTLCPRISRDFFQFILEHGKRLDAAIRHSRDYDFSYFGFKTLERSYLLKANGKIVERPQYMLMRVALGIHGDDLDAALETYNLMSERYFIHASSTLFSAGTINPQTASCFLMPIKEDSLEGIFQTLHECAIISKNAGGLGVAAHKVRATGTCINGTGGVSSGLVPMLRIFNDVSRYVDQGGNKRPGAITIYLEPWHADILDFLKLKRNTGSEEYRARDLFYALWIPDLFMERVKNDQLWSLFCPHQCPNLDQVYGDRFNQLYEHYENEGKRIVKRMRARELWAVILQSQVETGTPFMLYKDECNRKSNQQNLGTITCSNLCTEIIQYSSKEETAVCNLASLALNRFVITSENDDDNDDDDNNKSNLNVSLCATGEIEMMPLRRRQRRRFDYEKLRQMTRVLVRNLNKIIDRSKYPTEAAKRSNVRHRPLGIGVQGFADTLMLLRLPFESKEASQLNKNIFETIYYAALEESCELARRCGSAYESYCGSLISRGEYHYMSYPTCELSNLWNWQLLKENISKFGILNSLLVAVMPTATTAQILGNSEACEPYTGNIFTRRVLSGEYIVVNEHLLDDLVKLNLWNEDMKNLLLVHRGSIQNIYKIPQDLRNLYKTAWEIPVKVQIDMAAARAPFIDQSQSMNVYMAEPSFRKLSAVHFYAYSLKLKTGMYYLRTKSAADAIQFTGDAARALAYNVPVRDENGDSNQDTAESSIQCLACSG